MPKGIRLTEQDQADRRREIFRATVNLILEKGFHETSMREIAEAAGMGKSTLYDYFSTKEEILLFVTEEATYALMQQAQEITALGLPPAECLRRLMHMHLAFLQANGSLLLRLSSEVQRLGPESQRRIQQERYGYQDLVASIVQEGIAQGCFHPVHPLHAARLLINSLLSVLYTTRPTGSPEEMLDETLSIFLEGIVT